MGTDLLFGITESGVMHTDIDPQIPLETKFKMVKESGYTIILTRRLLRSWRTNTIVAAKSTNCRSSQGVGFMYLAEMRNC